MGRRGYAAQPAALKLLKGVAPGKDCAGRTVPTPPNFDRAAPEPPGDLSGEALLEWNRVVPGLDRLDLLKEGDYAALVEHCELWANYVAAARLARVDGIVITTDTGVTKVNPALTAMITLGTQLRNSCREFGLTPSSEQSLGATAKRDSGSDPFADSAAQA